LGGCGHLADCDERELHSWFSQTHTIAGVHPDSFLHALAIYQRTEGAVIEQYQFVAIVHECAVSPGYSGQTFRERDVAGGCWNGGTGSNRRGGGVLRLRGAADDK
jgi:hypothetical protein